VNALEIIGRKRDGDANSPEEIRHLLGGYVDGSVPDYQMAAWLMAVCVRGMNAEETLDLTRAMVESGETLDLGAIPGIKVDKHSTGGVGDTVTLVATPLAAACGVPVPKLSGRALGHTGGTIDKLESVPGVTCDLEPDRFIEQVRRIGIAIGAQSPRMVPADKAVYALRDATATVPSLPLIASSVMSKKIAAGADAIVLDVKFGRGAFMPDLDDAAALARTMVEIGEGAGRRTVALVTAMDEPLGRSVGDALEVLEAERVLAGEGDLRLAEVAIAVAEEMCRLSGVDADPAAVLARGAGRERFWDLLEAQGGERERRPVAHPVRLTVRATADGWVGAVDALQVGLAVHDIGGGRLRKGDDVDHGSGFTIEARVGDRVRRGDALVHVHAGSEEVARRALPRLEDAWRIRSRPVTPEPHVRRRVTVSGEESEREPAVAGAVPRRSRRR
jgi:pyrimidine-nucleoside phosphorylase